MKDLNDLAQKIINLEYSLEKDFNSMYLKEIEQLIKDLNLSDLIELDIKIKQIMDKNN